MLELQIGAALGTCTITEVLGRGGMSIVYRAKQSRPERDVAVKVLAPGYANDASFRHRFEREWNLASSLRHPNIVPIYEVGDMDGLLYVVMQCVEGGDLGHVLREGPQPSLERVLHLLDQAADALDAAHARHLVHRDVKPGNILVASGQGGEPADYVYLSDFGLTKRTDSMSELTASGAFLGTPNYMAPEQIEGREVDGRIDVYALGCVLFEALAGRPPYARSSEYATVHAHVNEPIPSVTEVRPDLPGAIDEVVHRAMAKDRDERFPTAGAMIAAARDATSETRRTAPAPPEQTEVVAAGEAVPPRVHTIAESAATRDVTRVRGGIPRGILFAAGGLAVLAAVAAAVLLLWPDAPAPPIAEIPSAIVASCNDGTSDYDGVESAMDCAGPGDISVSYVKFDDVDDMNSAYASIRDEQGLVPNLRPCFLAQVRGEYAFRDGGRVLCYADDQGNPWVVWTHPPSRILSTAGGSAGEREALNEFVQEEAGPESP